MFYNFTKTTDLHILNGSNCVACELYLNTIMKKFFTCWHITMLPYKALDIVTEIYQICQKSRGLGRTCWIESLGNMILFCHFTGYGS